MKFGTHNLGTNTYKVSEGIFEKKNQNGRIMTNQSSVTIKRGCGFNIQMCILDQRIDQTTPNLVV